MRRRKDSPSSQLNDKERKHENALLFSCFPIFVLCGYCSYEVEVSYYRSAILAFTVSRRFIRTISKRNCSPGI